MQGFVFKQKQISGSFCPQCKEENRWLKDNPDYWDSLLMYQLQVKDGPLHADKLGASFIGSIGIGGELGHISGTRGKWKNATWKQEWIAPGAHKCFWKDKTKWGRTILGWSEYGLAPEELNIWFNHDEDDEQWYWWTTEPIWVSRR